MKKFIYFIALACVFVGIPAMAAPGPHGGYGPGMTRPPMHGGVSIGHRPPMHHPPMHRPPHHIGMGRPLPPPPPIYRRPIIRPYYTPLYYPTTTYTTYTYYPYEPVAPVVPSATTVVVRDNYAGINTAANVINAAANVAATIRYITW